MSDTVVAAVIGGAATLVAAMLAVWLRHRLRGNVEDSGRGTYGIKIMSPTDGAVLAGSVDVVGTYDKRPPPGSLYVVHASLNGAHYWPQVGTSLEFDTSKKTWRAKMWISNDVRVFAMTAGPAGRALFRYYEKVGRTTGQWPAIDELPEDVRYQGNVVTVRVSAH